jgi:hypothetical protein
MPRGWWWTADGNAGAYTFTGLRHPGGQDLRVMELTWGLGGLRHFSSGRSLLTPPTGVSDQSDATPGETDLAPFDQIGTVGMCFLATDVLRLKHASEP